MYIAAEIYAWLTSIEIFKVSDNYKIDDQGNVLLDKKAIFDIQNGFLISKIIYKINLLLNEIYGNIFKLDEKLQNMENKNDNVIKLKNWSIISEYLTTYYGIKIDNDTKTLLVANDEETYNELFNHIYSFYISLEEKLKSKNNNKYIKEDAKLNEKSAIDKINERLNKLENLTIEDINKNDGNNTIIAKNNSRGNQRITPSQDNENYSNTNIPKIRLREDFVDLNNSNNLEKDISKSTSVLEFFLKLVCKSMNLNLKQSASLFTDNKKYLNYILTKGMQNVEFRPVKEYYQEYLLNLDFYINLIDINSISQPTQISKNIELSLDCLKPGLISKNVDIAYLAGRCLTKTAYGLIEKNLIASAWDWFVMPNGGLEYLIAMLNIHDYTSEICVALILNFGKYHINELFNIYLRKILDSNKLIVFLADIVENLSKNKTFCDQFIGDTALNDKVKFDDSLDATNVNNITSIKKSWMFLIKEEINSYNINNRINANQFLGEMWVFFSLYFETEDECIELLNLFKQSARDSNKLVRYSSITQMFRLIYNFSKERNFIAPVFYKSLVFILLEYSDDIYLRDYTISNFKQLFKIVQSIPVGILVEPYSKQIMYNLNKTYFFSLNDLNFIVILSKHPRLNVKDAILLLDILGKIYTECLYYYKVIKLVFLMLLSRYLMNQLGIEFTMKLIKYLIITFCNFDKEFSDKIYIHAIKANINYNDYEFPKEESLNLILNNEPKVHDTINEETNNLMIKKNSILEIIYEILLIKNSYLNNVVKYLLISSDIRHYKVYNFHNIWISKLINFYGDSQEILHYYNKNFEEIPIDSEFISQINKIYTKTPNIKDLKYYNIFNEGLENNNNYNEEEEFNKNTITDLNENIKKPTKFDFKENYNKELIKNPIVNKVINDINNVKEKFCMKEKNKHLKEEINKLKDEKFLPKSRRLSVKKELVNLKADLNNFLNISNNIIDNVSPIKNGIKNTSINKNNILNPNRIISNQEESAINKSNMILVSKDVNNADNEKELFINDQSNLHLYKKNENFDTYTNRRDVKIYLTNVDYDNLIKLEGFTNINKPFERNYINNNYLNYNVLNYKNPLINLNNEEDKDIIILKKVLKDYFRFFKFMMKKYSGSMYQPYHGKEFTSIKNTTETIVPAEIIKMFREHDIINKYVTKDEILMIIGYINLKIFKHSTSKNSLSYNEFVETFVQLSYYILNKPPYNYSNLSNENNSLLLSNYKDYNNCNLINIIPFYVLELINKFANNALSKGNLTIEYVHPNELLTPVEKEICNQINNKIEKYGSANVKIPDGYKKVLDLEIIYKYKIPKCMLELLGQSRVICIELLDEIISFSLLNSANISKIIAHDLNNIEKNNYIDIDTLSNTNIKNNYVKEIINFSSFVSSNNILSKITSKDLYLKDKFHILEPFIKVKETYKARPSYLKLISDKKKTDIKDEKVKKLFNKEYNTNTIKLPIIRTSYSQQPYAKNLNYKNNNFDITYIDKYKINNNKKFNIKDQEVKKIFDEIDGNQSDAEFKTTIKNILNESFNNKENENINQCDKSNNVINNNFNKLSYIENNDVYCSENIIPNLSDAKTDKLKTVKEKSINNLPNISIIKDKNNNITNNNESNIYNISNDEDLLEYSKNKSINETVLTKDNKSKLNKVKIEKIKEEELKKLELKEKELKRIKRMKFVKEELEKLKRKKEQKDADKLKILNEENIKKEQKLREKALNEAKMRMKIKEELEKMKRLKQHEEKIKQEKKKKESTTKYKKQAEKKEKFFDNQIDKLKKEFEEMTKKRKEEESKKKEKEELNKKKLVEDKIKFNEFFEEEKLIRKKEKDLFNSINSLSFLEDKKYYNKDK